MPMPDTHHAASDKSARLTHYGLAALTVMAAVGARFALDPVLHEHSPYLPFALAVIVTSRVGGRGPGLAATALSLLSAWYFLAAPRFSFAIPTPAAIGGLVLFAVVGAIISVLIGQVRTALVKSD